MNPEPRIDDSEAWYMYLKVGTCEKRLEDYEVSLVDLLGKEGVYT